MYNTSRTITEAALQKGSQIAYRGAGIELSFKELFLMAQATASPLVEAKPASVGIYCKTANSFIIAYYACLVSGIPAFLINNSILEEEVQSIAEDFEFSTLITDTNSESFSKLNIVYPVTDKVQGLDITDYEYVDLDENDIAIYLMTSGTTAKKKAVPVTHRNLLWTAEKFNEFMGIEEDQNEMVLIPLTHSFGARRIIAQLLLGGCIHSLDGMFNPAAALITIKKYSCTVLSLVPSQVRILNQYYPQDFADIGKRIKFVELSSEYMAPKEKEQLMETMPQAQIVMGYGLTEATRSALLHFRNDVSKLNMSGKPINGVEILILDEKDQPVINGEKGQVVIKGPNVASSYYGNAVKENSKFRDGCFHTGDCGFLDEDGYLSVVGRLDDFINVGGKKFHPNEIELKLSKEFPGIDCAISYMDDKLLGNRPVLCVAGKNVDTDPVLQYIAANFESFKHPAKVLPVESIEKTANGKIIRSKLRSQINNLFE